MYGGEENSKSKTAKKNTERKKTTMEICRHCGLLFKLEKKKSTV